LQNWKAQKMSNDHILNAGLKIWRDEGLEKVTLRKIADALNITHPGILYHFKTVAILKNAIAEHAVTKNDKKVIRQLIVSEHKSVAHFNKVERIDYLIY
jgi:AcrR family transcriptional regulator